MAPTRFRFARVQTDPLKAILQRVGLATALLMLVTLITYIGRDAYIDNEDPSQPLTFIDSLYYATVTITTTGYGDIVPVTQGSRLITTIVVTPIRILFIILLVGTTLQVLAEQSRFQFRLRKWQRDLSGPIPDAPLAPGYTIRPLGDGLELLERCYASGLGFHEGDIRVAVDNRDDPTWYRNIQTAPLYRRDLDLVAVAPDGAIAAFCTIWFDDVTRSAYFEPVATVPAHQRRGLGKALLTEGLRRLQRRGALVAGVGGYSPHANALYRSVMGDDHTLYEPWVKVW